MVRYWLGKFKESAISVLPIYSVVLLAYILGICGVNYFVDSTGAGIITNMQFLIFTICALMVAIGLTLFGHGAEESMTKVGRLVADDVMKRRKMFLVIFMSFVLGTAATIAEPDLNVVCNELAGVSDGFNILMLVTVGVGVGLFLVLGILRILFNKSLKVMYLAFYGLTMALAAVIDPNLMPLSFDGGGIPTGAITVPFVLAFGLGIASSKATGTKGEDSFGLIGLCSIGPVILMMLLMRIFNVDFATLEAFHIEDVGDNVGESFLSGFLQALQMVSTAIAPITVIFILYDIFVLKLPKTELLKMFFGLLFLYVGLLILFTGVYGGFMPIAYALGGSFGESKLLWLAMIVVFFFGSFGVLAEPAVHALCQSVEEVSEGGVKKVTVLLVMALAVGVADMLHVVRSYYQFNIMYLLVPLYIVALALMFIVPNFYTAVAFDAAGTSSGPVTAAFVLPFCVGFCYAVLDANEKNLTYVYGYGLCAMMSAVVPIALELIGVYVGVKRKLNYKRARERIIEPNDEQVIHLYEEVAY